MPVSPSELPWWGWLIGALAFGIVALITYRFGQRLKVEGGESWIFLFLALLLCIGMLGFGFMGLIRFIK
jgi:hypothetical protein